MNNLAFSTNLEDHKGLLHQLARKSTSRMLSMGISATHDDAYQEACLSCFMASKTYDPSKGISFTAYMGRSVWNNFNRSVASVIGEQESFGMLSVEDLSTENPAWADFIPTDQETIEEKMLNLAATRDRIALFSVEAKRVIRDLISPSRELTKHHSAMLDYSLHAKELFEGKGDGRRPRCPEEINLRFITKFHNISYVGFVREVKEKLGIDIR